MDQFRALGPGAPETDGGPAGLIILEITARGNLPVEVLTRQPHLDIIGLGRGKAHVPGAQHHHPVMQPQFLEDLLRVLQQTLQMLVGALRGGELHQLHLIELVLADEAPDVLTVGAGLGAEAGRVSGIFEGQVVLLQDFVPVDVGHRHLRGGHQKIIPILQLEEVFLELGKLAGALHGGPVGHERRQNLQIPVFAGVEVQHKVDQGPLQQGACPFKQGEAGPGDLGGPLKVQDAQGLADVPVGFGFKVKLRGLAPGMVHRVIVRGRAQGDGRVGQVGDIQEEVPDPGFLLLHPGLQGFAFSINAGDPRLEGFGLRFFSGLHQGSHLLGQGVALMAQLFQPGQQAAALRLPL